MKNEEICKFLGDKTARAIIENVEGKTAPNCTILFRTREAKNGCLHVWFDVYENDIRLPIDLLNVFIATFHGLGASIYLNANYECRSMDNILIVTKNGVFLTENQQNFDVGSEEELEKNLKDFERNVVENVDDFKKKLTKLDGSAKQIAHDLFEDFSADKEKWASLLTSQNRKLKKEFFEALEVMQICLKENINENEQNLVEKYVANEIE